MINLIIILILCFKLSLTICPCGQFGPGCSYFYNKNLLRDSDYELYAYDFPEIKSFENRDCFLNYDETIHCICKEGFVLNSKYKCVLDRCYNFSCKDFGRCVLLNEMPVCVCGSVENKDNITCNQSACISGTFVPQPYCSIQGNCISEKNGDLKCICQSESYSGKYCEKVTNLCETNKCLNGGTCVKNSVSNFCCLCTSEYSGKLCEFSMTSTSLNEINFHDMRTSDSTKKYQFQQAITSQDGIDFFTGIEIWTNKSINFATNRINSIDEITTENSEIGDFCQSYPCKNNASCINLSKNYKCICPVFFNGINCEHEEDDCYNSPCFNNSTCINYLGIGNYGCECDPLFTGKNCEIVINLCDYQPCLNKGMCIFNETYFKYSCICQDGFRGMNCEIKMNICEKIKCLNGGYCVSYQNLSDISKQYSNFKIYKIHFECVCTSYFFGKYCESEKSDHKKIVIVARTIGIASVISIASFYTFVIFMDLSKIICKTSFFPR